MFFELKQSESNWLQMGHVNQTLGPSNYNAKYAKTRMKKGEKYIAKDCVHLENIKLYV